jgi:hypothetical protein
MQSTKFDDDTYQGLGIAVKSLIIFETPASDPLAPVGLFDDVGVWC